VESLVRRKSTGAACAGMFSLGSRLLEDVLCSPAMCSPAMRAVAMPCVAMCCVAIVVGCAGGNVPVTAPVTGVVTRAGQPLAGATVVFSTVEPVAGFGRLVATGRTGDDGRFTLVTRIDSRRSAPGAAIADHRVTVSASMPPAGMTEAAYQAQLAAHQQKIDSQGLIAAGDGPGPRVSALKPEFSDSARTPLAAKVASGGANDFTFAVE